MAQFNTYDEAALVDQWFSVPWRSSRLAAHLALDVLAYRLPYKTTAEEQIQTEDLVASQVRRVQDYLYAFTQQKELEFRLEWEIGLTAPNNDPKALFWRSGQFLRDAILSAQPWGAWMGSAQASVEAVQIPMKWAANSLGGGAAPNGHLTRIVLNIGPSNDFVRERCSYWRFRDATFNAAEHGKPILYEEFKTTILALNGDGIGAGDLYRTAGISDYRQKQFDAFMACWEINKLKHAYLMFDDAEVFEKMMTDDEAPWNYEEPK